MDHGPASDRTRQATSEAFPSQLPTPAGPFTVLSDRPVAARPAAELTVAAPAPPELTAQDPVNETTRLLLRLIAAGQERERQHLCDVFHDGPIQDLTAVLLTCAAVRRTLTGPAAERLAAVETQLRDAITTLQLPAPSFRAGNDARKILATALANRVRGPLARDLDTVLEVDDAPPSRAEAAEVLSAVQLLLLESDPRRPARHASVTVQSSRDGVTLLLWAVPDPCSATSLDATQDALARTGRLRRVAAVLGARVTEDQPGGGWRASLTWPRKTPSSPATRARLDTSGPNAVHPSLPPFSNTPYSR